jgi:hypothetical protein
MNDPFDILRDQLEAAARPRPRGARASARRRGGPVLVTAASALSVIAVAAAVTAERQQPRTAGSSAAPGGTPVPRVSPGPDRRPAPGGTPVPNARPAPGGTPVPNARPAPNVSPVPETRPAPGISPAPQTVPIPNAAPPAAFPGVPDFEFRPDLTAGRIGWCASLRGVNGCGPAASPERGLIVGVGRYGRAGGTVAAVVSERVAAAVLPGGRRLLARPDPRVPAPSKLILEDVPRETGPLRLVDANGRDVPDTDARGSWATSLARLPTRKSDPDAPCALSVHGDARFRVRSTSVLTKLPKGRDDVVRPSFLSCATTVYYAGRTRLRAAVLLDAADPRAKAPLLPGMDVEPRGIVQTGPFTSATRAGDGWIQVFGKGAALRKRLLSALTARVP